MLTLSEKQVKELEQVIAEMPTKFGVLVLNILNQKAEVEPEENGVQE
jgi:hypothetical protein